MLMAKVNKEPPQSTQNILDKYKAMAAGGGGGVSASLSAGYHSETMDRSEPSTSKALIE